jgi:hypothetical protein
MVLDQAAALKLATAKLKEKSTPEDDWVVVNEDTIEKPFGWIFFYNTREFIATGNVIHSLAGNGPVVVERDSGAVKFFGSADPLSVIIDAYQQPGKRGAA